MTTFGELQLFRSALLDIDKLNPKHLNMSPKSIIKSCLLFWETTCTNVQVVPHNWKLSIILPYHRTIKWTLCINIVYLHELQHHQHQYLLQYSELYYAPWNKLIYSKYFPVVLHLLCRCFSFVFSICSNHFLFYSVFIRRLHNWGFFRVHQFHVAGHAHWHNGNATQFTPYFCRMDLLYRFLANAFVREIAENGFLLVPTLFAV